MKAQWHRKTYVRSDQTIAQFINFDFSRVNKNIEKETKCLDYSVSNQSIAES